MALAVFATLAPILMRLQAERRRSYEADQLAKAITDLSSRQNGPAAPNTLTDALAMDYGKDRLHEKVDRLSPVNLRRSLSISVRNTGNGYLSNCRVAITNVSPATNHVSGDDLLLAEEFTLQQHESRFIELVHFDERATVRDPDALVHIISPGSRMTFPANSGRMISIRALASNSREYRAAFYVEVIDGVLTMRKL